MIKLLLELWPAFIPSGIFLVWYLASRKNTDAQIYDEFQEKKKRYMFYSIIGSCILIIIMLLYYGLHQPRTDRLEMQDNMVENGIR